MSDLFIKFLFGTEEHNKLLLSFINSVLEDSDFGKITQATLKNPFNYRESIMEREVVLDVKATDEFGRTFDVEVQVGDLAYFHNRSVYYWAKVYTAQLHKGNDFSLLKPVICINLIDGVMFKQIKRVHTCFSPAEIKEPQYLLTDHLMIHFIELGKIPDQNESKKALLNWITYFKHEGKEEEDMLIFLNDDPVMEQAHEAYILFSQDDQLREAYEAREKWIKQRNTDLKVAALQGKNEGKLEGKIEEKRMTAHLMKEKGYPMQDIMEITGLSKEEIEKIDM